MAVRLVIGRAGAGKTAHCLSAVHSALRASPVDGCRLILLVPEQASLQVERALIGGLEGAAVHRAEVLSFRRLAYRVLAWSGDGGRSVLSSAGRTMLLRLLLIRHAPGLRYYKRLGRYTGFIEQLGRTITEFIEESVSPDELPSPDAASADDPVRAAKLHDLGLIYKAYLDALGADRMDPSQQLEIARGRLDRCEWLDGAHIWVDGFAGFSRQEGLMLAALAIRAEKMDLAVLTDPDYTPGTARGGGRSSGLFAKTQRTIAELTDLFGERGIEMETPLELRGHARRFERRPSLAHIERHLFGPVSTGPAPTEGVRIVQAADRRTEVDWAVSQIQELVQRTDSSLRYRDIAIVVRDLEPYHALVSAALQARGIPYFIDRRRPTAHHPLVELLRGLLSLAADDYSVESVRMLLKTGFLSLDDDQEDALENHLLATAVDGRERWDGDDWELPPREREEPSRWAIAAMKRINDARRRVWEDVDSWAVAATGGVDATGAVWAERIRAVLLHLGAQERVERWAAQADDEGDLDQGEAHRQTWRDVDALLDDLQTALGDYQVCIDELRSIVEAALAQLTLGLAPPMLDQVLVGSIERSRHPEIKAVFLLGLNEGVFPAVPAEDSILNDDDRSWLDENGCRLGTPRAQRVLDESMLLYVACTRPSEMLVVSYSAADQNGGELQPSPYLDALCAACPGLQVESVGDPFGERADWAIHTVRELAGHLAYEFRQRVAVPDDDTLLRGRWNALYEATRTDREMASGLSTALRSLTYDNAASLGAVSVALVARDPFRASVSQLETFATCPFKHFAQYRLRLKERQLSQLAMVDIGTLHHAILETFIQTLVGRGQSIGELDDAAMLEALRESCNKVGESIPLAGELSHARDRYMMARSQSELSRVLEGQRRVSKSGSFRPRAAELRFGFAEEGGLPALELTTPAGRKVALRGVIDRVDLAEVSDEVLGVVVDYKRTRDKRLDLSGVYHGLSLQLLGYLLVLAQGGRTLAGRSIKPAGAFYVSLVESYQRVAHPDDADDKDTRTLAYRPRGLLDVGRLAALDSDSEAAGWSPFYQVYRKKDGGIGHVDRSDAADPQSFADLLEHTRLRMGELSDRLLDGDVSVRPYRLGTFSPCSWCPFDSVCRFESGQTPMRFLEKLARSEVFQRLTSGLGQPSDG